MEGDEALVVDAREQMLTATRFSYGQLNPRTDGAPATLLYIDPQAETQHIRDGRVVPNSQWLLGCSYIEDDRFRQMSGLAVSSREAADQAEQQVGNRDSALYFERWLQIMYGQSDLQIRRIMANCGRDGYARLSFAFTTPEREQQAIAQEAEAISEMRERERAQWWGARALRWLRTGSQFSI